MKNNIQKQTNERVSGFGLLSCGIVAVVFSLASCNLLFLNLGYEDADPTFERLNILYDDSQGTMLWPTAEITLHDDTGIDSVSCSIQTGDGEAKGFTLTRTNERERYVWKISRGLGDIVSAGTNTLTFSAVDLAGHSRVEQKKLYLSAEADAATLKRLVDTTKTPWEASFWHPSGITDIKYHYLDASDSTVSDEYTLTNSDDGTSGGGVKLFKGAMATIDPSSCNSVLFTATVNGTTIEVEWHL